MKKILITFGVIFTCGFVITKAANVVIFNSNNFGTVKSVEASKEEDVEKKNFTLEEQKKKIEEDLKSELSDIINIPTFVDDEDTRKVITDKIKLELENQLIAGNTDVLGDEFIERISNEIRNDIVSEQGNILKEEVRLELEEALKQAINNEIEKNNQDIQSKADVVLSVPARTSDYISNFNDIYKDISAIDYNNEDITHKITHKIIYEGTEVSAISNPGHYEIIYIVTGYNGNLVIGVRDITLVK